MTVGKLQDQCEERWHFLPHSVRERAARALHRGRERARRGRRGGGASPREPTTPSCARLSATTGRHRSGALRPGLGYAARDRCFWAAAARCERHRGGASRISLRSIQRLGGSLRGDGRAAPAAPGSPPYPGRSPARRVAAAALRPREPVHAAPHSAADVRHRLRLGRRAARSGARPRCHAARPTARRASPRPPPSRGAARSLPPPQSPPDCPRGCGRTQPAPREPTTSARRTSHVDGAVRAELQAQRAVECNELLGVLLLAEYAPICRVESICSFAAEQDSGPNGARRLSRLVHTLAPTLVDPSAPPRVRRRQQSHCARAVSSSRLLCSSPRCSASVAVACSYRGEARPRGHRRRRCRCSLSCSATDHRGRSGGDDSAPPSGLDSACLWNMLTLLSSS